MYAKEFLAEKVKLNIFIRIHWYWNNLVMVVMLNSIIKKRLPYFELCPRSCKSYSWDKVQFIVRQSLYE